MNPMNASGKSRVLVTGGAGFIGSKLCSRLLELNYEVICLDNFSSSERSTILPLLKNPKFELIRHDVVEYFACEVDFIYNLACPASPLHYQSNPVKTLLTSVIGGQNVLKLAQANNARVLQASTSEVYGDPTISPQSEDYWGHVNCVGIRSCYDEGKRAAETLFVDFHRQHNVDIRIARIFNTYGPTMHPFDGRVVSNFVLQALQNKDITIYGDGSQTRSFCFVDDLVEGLITLMHSSEYVGPINLGNPVECTVKTLAERIIQLTNSKSKLTFHKYPDDDPKRRKPDIRRAREILNWEPKVQLDEGLIKTIEYFRQLDISSFRIPPQYQKYQVVR